MRFDTAIFPGPLCRVSPAGRWVEIVYAASLLQQATRPALVIADAAGGQSRMRLPAPVLGRGIWIGLIPRDTASLRIEYPGDIRIERLTVRSAFWRAAHALLRRPRHAFAALALAGLGRRDRARRRIARALTEQPMSAYPRWASSRRRDHDPQGLDALPPELATVRASIDVALSPGETLTPWALDAAARAFAADPALNAIRGDSEDLAPDGPAAGFASAWTPVEGAIFRRRGAEGGAIRPLRIVLTRHAPRLARPVSTAGDPATWPSVAVIVPTRDRLDLLRVCIDGVLQRTDYPDLSLIVADNDSIEPGTRAFLDALPGRDGRARVLPCPGGFNFSAICNRAAAAASADILVFLNNDIEITEAGWLKALVRHALGPGAGAVGPTLLYPNGRIQHAGVALGPGGTAGHILRDKPASALGALASPRAVAAVTGACLAVRRDRFEAVGGFDEAFAVIYNDVDLCLRLAARGWGALWLPDIRLVHRESASRRNDRGDASSVARFAERWAALIADDPHFHPVFSDAALDLALA